jgi:hypothetical protein
MGRLIDSEIDTFCRLIACGYSAAEAYRQSIPKQLQPTSIWEAASRLKREHIARIEGLRRELAAAASDELFIKSKTELMQYLSRAIDATPETVDESSDLVQEIKITPTEAGNVTQLKIVNKLNAVQQLAAIAQYTAPPIANLHLHKHEAPQGPKLESLADNIAGMFALPAPSQTATVIEAEVLPSKPAKPKKKTTA